MTPSRWLAGFREIEAIDLDPLARPLFGLRHGATLRAAQSNWRFHHEDGFESLEQLLTRWPQAVVLFDNVLGQMRYRYEDGLTLERRLSRLAERLQGRLWGSVHDWLSGPANPASGDDGLDRTFAFEMRVHPGPAGVPRLTVPDAAGAEDDLAQWLLARVGGYGVWQDHLTGGVFPGGSVGTLIPWSFSPTHVHWLQAAWVDARVRVEA